MPYRQSNVRWDVTAGTHHLGIADKWDGGDGDSDMGTYARASGTKQLGGTQTRADATATYLCDEHFWSVWRSLDRTRGQLAVVAVGNVYGDDGTPMVGGEPITLRGILKTVPVPKGDFSSNNGNEIPLVLSLDAEAA